MPQDSHGLALTAASEEAARHYDDTVRAYLGFELSTGDHLKKTFSADPEMPMAMITRGYFFHLFCVPALERRAVQAGEQVEALLGSDGGLPRERQHLRALRAWNRGDMTAATEAWEDILLHWPHDTLALRLSHFSHFYLTGGQAMRQSAERIMHAWTPDMPDYGYVMGVRAFANEEAGSYAAAEEHGREAVAINRRDIWATHAVAHVLEMQGRHREGVAWLDDLSSEWEGLNNFRFHTWWHKSLFHLELGEYDAVLALYDKNVRGEQTEEYLDLTNGAAMLWRLELLGVDVGDRWQELADVSERHAEDSLLVFADAHYMMALAATGRLEAAERLLTAMRKAAEGDGDQAAVARDVGIGVCEATLALRQGEPRRALAMLLPLRDRIRRLGGSHAQRDIWAQMLLQAARDSGDQDATLALLAQRTRTKHNSPTSWRWYAEALETAGNQVGAEEARRQAEAAMAA